MALRPYQLVGLTMPNFVCIEASLLQCMLKTALTVNSPKADVEYFRDHGFELAMRSSCKAANVYAEAQAKDVDLNGKDGGCHVPDLTVYLEVLGAILYEVKPLNFSCIFFWSIIFGKHLESV